MINQVNSAYWHKMNGLFRYILAHSATQYFPLYVINEYPKSGGSWVGDMLSDALRIPFPRNRLPMLRSSILHGHMMHSWNMRNVILVWRDGRDVLISQYYHSLFLNDRGNARLVAKCRSDLGFTNYDNISENLITFMEYVYEAKRHPRMSWSEFVDRWADCKRCVHVRYEDLRARPVDELKRVVKELSDTSLDDGLAASIVDKHSFERVSGRRVGEADIGSFLRKGVVGDWTNYFNHDACVRFGRYAGNALIKLGYESGNEWIDSCKPASAYGG